MSQIIQSNHQPSPEPPLNHVLICPVHMDFSRLNTPSPLSSSSSDLCSRAFSSSVPFSGPTPAPQCPCEGPKTEHRTWGVASAGPSSTDGTSTASLGSLVQCLTTLTARTSCWCPIPLLSFCLKPFPLSCHSMALSQVPLQISCSTFRYWKVSPDCFS